jgi:hypothetical protein
VPVAPADTIRIARVVTGLRPTVEVTNRAPWAGKTGAVVEL